jgi:hypothetical protein
MELVSKCEDGDCPLMSNDMEYGSSCNITGDDVDFGLEPDGFPANCPLRKGIVSVQMNPNPG